MAALLDVSDVTLRYKTSSAVVTATERVSFSVDRSDRFVLLGHDRSELTPADKVRLAAAAQKLSRSLREGRRRHH